jgi:3-oxoacyl-[acyl-carrier protein] reductase
LAHEGLRLVLTASNRENLGEVVATLKETGGKVAGISCDLANPAAIPALAREAGEVYGSLDFLINNAGWSVNKPFHETTDEEWARCMAVNATAPFILCRECLPALRRSDHATIINIGSVVALKGYKNQAAYGASKHALLGFTKVLAQEVQPFGIRVHAINPGGVGTEMIREMRPDLDPEGLMLPDEIADWVVFLLTHRGNAVIDDIHLRRASGDPWY